MWSILQLILLVIFTCIGCEFLIRPIFQKRHLANIEKQIYQWAELIGKDGVVNAEQEKNDVSNILHLYESTNFDNSQIVLQTEIARLIFMYVNTTFRILTQRGIQMTAFEKDDAEETVEKPILLEKQKHQLESVIKNLLPYINSENEE